MADLVLVVLAVVAVAVVVVARHAAGEVVGEVPNGWDGAEVRSVLTLEVGRARSLEVIRGFAGPGIVMDEVSEREHTEVEVLTSEENELMPEGVDFLACHANRAFAEVIQRHEAFEFPLDFIHLFSRHFTGLDQLLADVGEFGGVKFFESRHFLIGKLDCIENSKRFWHYQGIHKTPCGLWG